MKTLPNIHPDEVLLEEFLTPMGISKNALARAVGVPPRGINEIVLGNRCVHRSEDAANYLRGDEGIDFLYAHRPASLRLLAEARERDTAMGRLRVVSAEGLVGFKLQAFVNNPKRTQDIEDIRALLRANR